MEIYKLKSPNQVVPKQICDHFSSRDLVNSFQYSFIFGDTGKKKLNSYSITHFFFVTLRQKQGIEKFQSTGTITEKE